MIFSKDSIEIINRDGKDLYKSEEFKSLVNELARDMVSEGLA